MSWSTRTWQPAVRRDWPLLAVLAFFVAPSAFFLTAWYVYYYSSVTARVVLIGVGVAGTVSPPLICYRLARRAGRRASLWFVLVLSGALLAHWLPARYLLLDGPLPPSAHTVVPRLFREALSTTAVSILPLVMGMVPVIMYGLAVGLDRPLAGVPPRGAVFLTAAGGSIVWSMTLFLSLLNPGPPLFVETGPQVEVAVDFGPQPTGTGDAMTASRERLLWRLHDGLPPGATQISEHNAGLRMQLPGLVQTIAVRDVMLGTGLLEFVDAGDAPPPAGTEVSTSLLPLPTAEMAFETVLENGNILKAVHWSGVSIGSVAMNAGNDTAILTVYLNADGVAELQKFSDENPGEFLAMVLDNVVILSFPVRSSVEGNVLTVRRVEPVLAAPLTAILRYGPLPLTPVVEVLSQPTVLSSATHGLQPEQIR